LFAINPPCFRGFLIGNKLKNFIGHCFGGAFLFSPLPITAHFESSDPGQRAIFIHKKIRAQADSSTLATQRQGGAFLSRQD